MPVAAGSALYVVLEASPNAVFAVDASGAIKYVNAQAEAMFGYERAELLGQRIELLLPEHVRERHIGHREGFIAHPVARHMGIGLVLAGRRKDGSEFPVEIGLSPVETAEGLQIFAVVVDITTRKRAEDQLLHNRSTVVEALGHLTLSAAPEEAAETVVAELARLAGYDFIAVSQLVRGDRLCELATYNPIAGVRSGGALLGPNLSRDLVARARLGPWVEDVVPPTDDVRTAAFAAADIDIGAGAPIYAGDQLVGLLSLGVDGGALRSTPARKAGLLAAAIDYATILSAVAGPALADRRDMDALRSRLHHVLTTFQFQPVFQPIVGLESHAVVGYEALTRFTDGTRPDLRFTEAASVGLGHDYELATMEAALRAAPSLPEDAFLTLNMSPRLVLERGRRLRKLVEATSRRLIFELTEHVPIDDYAELREAIGKVGNVGIAVDDAGAGYTSLRHILELRPTYVKLDISLVGGIDTDELRQALVAGLVYFALRSGCHLIAEGVESEGEATTLRHLGIEFAQGYLFGQPEPIAT